MKYKILEQFVLNGVTMKVDDIVDLDYQRANLKSIQGMIEKVPDNTVAPDSSVLGSVIPGVPLTPDQKEKLAKENAAESAEAHRLAGEQRAKDQVEGNAKPAVNVVADSLKDKLVHGEFENKGDLPDEVDPNNLP